jgi:peptidoglycan/xylan/chitin deacetylase (PgdA/CDA1 family)
MDARKFQRRLALLNKWGYPVIPLTQAIEGLDGGRLPKSATVITIDDGWYSTYVHMLPALLAHSYPATIYLTTYYCVNQAPVIDVALDYCFQQIDSARCPEIHISDFAFGPLPTGTDQEKALALAAAVDAISKLQDDARRQLFLQSVCKKADVDYEKLLTERWFHLMNAEEVQDAAEKGVSVEMHTHRHRIRYDDEDCLEQELVLNSGCIEDITGRGPVHFCYPSGRFSQEIWPHLNDAGVTSATTTELGMVDGQSAIYALPRLLDGQNISELEFEAEMSGFMELIRQASTSLGFSRRKRR